MLSQQSEQLGKQLHEACEEHYSDDAADELRNSMSETRRVSNKHERATREVGLHLGARVSSLTKFKAPQHFALCCDLGLRACTWQYSNEILRPPPSHRYLYVKGLSLEATRTSLIQQFSLPLQGSLHFCWQGVRVY